MSNKVTITDIAKALNTTAATVSRALNNNPAISQAMRDSVNEMAAKMGYLQNRIASSLRRGKTYIIGVLIPSADINFFGSIVHGIENIAGQHGYNILLFQTNEKEAQEKKGIDTFLSLKVDGILASLAKETRDYSHFNEVEHQGTPLVFFDRVPLSQNYSSVVIDDFQGAYDATMHLLKKGYKRIAHISGPLHISTFEERLKGYRKALADAGISFRDQWLYKGDVSIEDGKKAITYFLDQQEPPDAVFAVEDYTALGAILELKSRKIAIPQQMGVFGFANELFDEYITPSLSSVNQQTVKMGEDAMGIMLDILEKNKKNTVRKIVIKSELIFRESSAGPATKN